jgi:hypothetical protein
MVLPFAKKGSNHVPTVVNIDTSIPKARIFRFENYWVDFPGFKECVHGLGVPPNLIVQPLLLTSLKA